MDDNDYFKIRNNPFIYTGRIHRTAFWITFLCLVVLLYLWGHFFIKFFSGNYEVWVYVVIYFFYNLALCLLLFLSALCAIKRLRDVKRNPWYSLLIPVPLANIALFLYLGLVPSQWKDE